jgi:DDE family transposase
MHLVRFWGRTTVVVIALMAVLAGASGPTAIALGAALKAEFLLETLDLPKGIPCKDVVRRVMVLLKPTAFSKLFDITDKSPE